MDCGSKDYCTTLWNKIIFVTDYILLQSISASLFNVSECLVHEDCESTDYCSPPPENKCIDACTLDGNSFLQGYLSIIDIKGSTSVRWVLYSYSTAEQYGCCKALSPDVKLFEDNGTVWCNLMGTFRDAITSNLMTPCWFWKHLPVRIRAYKSYFLFRTCLIVSFISCRLIKMSVFELFRSDS